MKTLLTLFLSISLLIGCKKKDDKPEFIVTYTFTSNTPAYYVQIWDGVGSNDFADSVHTPSFSKTITYDYSGTYRCKISSTPQSHKAISITYNGSTNTYSDSVYSSLESFITSE